MTKMFGFEFLEKLWLQIVTFKKDASQSSAGNREGAGKGRDCHAGGVRERGGNPSPIPPYPIYFLDQNQPIRLLSFLLILSNQFKSKNLVIVVTAVS